MGGSLYDVPEPRTRRRFIVSAAVGAGAVGALVGAQDAEAASDSAAFANGLTITEDNNAGANAANHQFTLAPRSKPSLAFPVPFFRPTKPNTIIALDLGPNGTPTENTVNGIAWIDVCDKDFFGADLRGESMFGSTLRLAACATHNALESRGIGVLAKHLYISCGRNAVIQRPQIDMSPSSGKLDAFNCPAKSGTIVIGSDRSNVVLTSGLGVKTDATRGYMYVSQMVGTDGTSAPPPGPPLGVPAWQGRSIAKVINPTDGIEYAYFSKLGAPAAWHAGQAFA